MPAPLSDKAQYMRTLLQEAGIDSDRDFIDPEVFAKLYLDSLAEILEEPLHSRLGYLLKEELTHRHTREETRAFLLRPIKVGGMGLDEEDTKSVLADFDEKKTGLRFVETEQIIPTSALEEHGSQTDEQEIEQIIEKRTPLLTFSPSVSTDEIVTQICAHEIFALVDEDKKARCREIVRARVREVRDAFQTRTFLEKPFADGGLGITGRLLAQLTGVIEQAVDHVRQQAAEKIKQEKEKHQQEREQQAKEKTELQKKEEQLLAKHYVDKTGRMPPQAVAPAAPPLARASASVSAHAQMRQQESRLDTQKLRAVIQKASASATVKPSLVKPRMQDVQLTRRLSGPLEELKAMSLTGFRRLARDPVQAIQRLKDLIELLEDQGYEKRVEGIRAFRSSPLYRVYTSVTQAALFSNIPIEEALKKPVSEGMKKEEYDQLMEFNTMIRF